jgi:hypothetical protein
VTISSLVLAIIFENVVIASRDVFGHAKVAGTYIWRNFVFFWSVLPRAVFLEVVVILGHFIVIVFV